MADGEPLGTEIRGRFNSVTEFEAPVTGEYTAVVRDAGLDPRFRLGLGVRVITISEGEEPRLIAGRDRNLLNGEEFETPLMDGEFAVIRFDAANGETVRIASNRRPDPDGRYPGVIDQRVTIYAPDGTLVTRRFDNRVIDTTFMVEQGGTYTAVLTLIDGAFMPQSFGVRVFAIANDDPPQIISGRDRVLRSGQRFDAALEPGQFAVYQLHATAGSAVDLSILPFTTGDLGSRNALAEVAVYDPNGQRIQRRLDQNAFDVAFLAQETGTYTFLISESDELGDVEAVAYRGRAIVSPGSSAPVLIPGRDARLESGERVETDLEVGDVAIYRFTAPFGETVQFIASERFDVADGPTDASIRVKAYSPSGQLLADQTGDLQSVITFTAPQSGHFTFLVHEDRAGRDFPLPVEVTAAVGPPNQTPTVTGGVFRVPFDAQNRTLVGTVQAEDPDSEQTLRYEIIGGNDDGAFAINANNGRITVRDRSKLRPIARTVPLLTVRVTDDGAPSLSNTTQVRIDILRAPKFLGVPPILLADARFSGEYELSRRTTVRDLQNSSYGGGLLRIIQLPAGRLSGDRISLETFMISIPAFEEGQPVIVDRVEIGTLDVIEDGRIDIRLNANATPRRVERIFSSATFNPGEAGPDREIRFILEEANGRRGQAKIRVQTRVEEPEFLGVPRQISAPTGGIFREVAPDAILRGPDNFEGATLRLVQFATTRRAGDEVRFQSTGNVSIKFDQGDARISVGRVYAGEFDRSAEDRTAIRLSRDVTVREVSELIRAIRFRSTSDGPDRDLRIVLETATGERFQSRLFIDTTPA